MPVIGDALVALRHHFGFENFRQGQEEVVAAILERRDAVVVMPTGSGKSLCYQLPALMRDGATLVVSPLIALMKDQVDALAARGLPATFINSSLSTEEQRRRIYRLRAGDFKIVYVAPERFRSQLFCDSLRPPTVSLFAVDEAHCISTWGHDFRPDYLKLKSAIAALGRPQVVALTATATPYVRSDILKQLGIEKAGTFVSGFDRPNLAITVVHVTREREKISFIKRLAQASGGSGIVYASTRKAVEQVVSKLRAAQLSVIGYHAGMTGAARVGAQNDFMSGRTQIIVATNAFGMGIDKPDIRFVAHYQMPGSIEAYYQEIGRAGRDGLPATCALLFNYADKNTHEFFIEGSYPKPVFIREVYQALFAIGQRNIELSARELVAYTSLNNEMAVNSALKLLENAGHIQRLSAQENNPCVRLKMGTRQAREIIGTDQQAMMLVRILDQTDGAHAAKGCDVQVAAIARSLGADVRNLRAALGRLHEAGIVEFLPVRRSRGIFLVDDHPQPKLRIDEREVARHQALEQRKLREIISFCYSERCYRFEILDYFGDRHHGRACGACGNCAGDVLNLLQRDVRVSQTTPASDEVNGEGAVTPRPLTPDELLRVRKMLACVARVKGRYGKSMVAATLNGSKAKEIYRLKLDQLSTYGLLSDMSQAEIVKMLGLLVEARCLQLSPGPYPLVSLTPLGADVMRERALIELPLPSSKYSSAAR